MYRSLLMLIAMGVLLASTDAHPSGHRTKTKRSLLPPNMAASHSTEEGSADGHRHLEKSPSLESFQTVDESHNIAMITSVPEVLKALKKVQTADEYHNVAMITPVPEVLKALENVQTADEYHNVAIITSVPEVLKALENVQTADEYHNVAMITSVPEVLKTLESVQTADESHNVAMITPVPEVLEALESVQTAVEPHNFAVTPVHEGSRSMQGQENHVPFLMIPVLAKQEFVLDSMNRTRRSPQFGGHQFDYGQSFGGHPHGGQQFGWPTPQGTSRNGIPVRRAEHEFTNVDVQGQGRFYTLPNRRTKIDAVGLGTHQFDSHLNPEPSYRASVG